MALWRGQRKLASHRSLGSQIPPAGRAMQGWPPGLAACLYACVAWAACAAWLAARLAEPGAPAVAQGQSHSCSSTLSSHRFSLRELEVKKFKPGIIARLDLMMPSTT